MKELECTIQAYGSVEIPEFGRNSPYDLLCLAALKRCFHVCCSAFDNPFLLAGSSESPAEFPVSLFFHSHDRMEFLGSINSPRWYNYINYYNIDHRFSRWLIEQQHRLQEQAPGIYDGLMRTMVLGKSKDTIRSELNAVLSRLERFPGNPFGVTPELYIQDGELV